MAEHHGGLIWPGLRRRSVHGRCERRSGDAHRRRHGEWSTRAGVAGGGRVPIRTLEQRDGFASKRWKRKRRCPRIQCALHLDGSIRRQLDHDQFERQRQGVNRGHVHRRTDNGSSSNGYAHDRRPTFQCHAIGRMQLHGCADKRLGRRIRRNADPFNHIVCRLSVDGCEQCRLDHRHVRRKWNWIGNGLADCRSA